MIARLFTFWFTYLVVGSIITFSDKSRVKYNEVCDNVSMKQVFVVIISNIIVSFFYYQFLWSFSHYFDNINCHDILSLLISFLLSDIIFYHGHRLMHQPFLYRYHKMHHVFKSPYALTSVYCHPIEMILVNLNTVLIGPLITNMSEHIMIIWLILAACDTVINHSGRSILGHDSKHHDIHHLKLTCNYGSTRLYDWLYNTEDK